MALGRSTEKSVAEERHQYTGTRLHWEDQSHSQVKLKIPRQRGTGQQMQAVTDQDIAMFQNICSTETECKPSAFYRVTHQPLDVSQTNTFLPPAA